jgi:hypothetical protein
MVFWFISCVRKETRRVLGLGSLWVSTTKEVLISEETSFHNCQMEIDAILMPGNH